MRYTAKLQLAPNTTLGDTTAASNFGCLKHCLLYSSHGASRHN